VLSLRVSRDKRGYDHIYLLLEARRRGRVENRLLYCGRWPSPCRVGLVPFDDETRSRLEQAHPDVPFDWTALLKTLQAALGMARPPLAGPPPPPSRSRRPPPPSSGTPYPYGGSRSGSSAGSPRQAPGPGSSRPDAGRPGAHEPNRPPGSDEREREYEPGHVVLVTAEFEQPDAGYGEPAFADQTDQESTAQGFEPVCEDDRPFAAGVALELVTEEILRIEVPGPAPTVTSPTGGHVFAQASGPATFDPADPAETVGEDEADAGEPDDAHAAAGTTATADPAAARPQRRRRRRGGRGRGKPPDIRQGSE
jgi:hypothetical protein